jgi:hypothetical protein
MRTSFAAVTLSVLALVICGPALAQQKTEKACQAEWRANRAANQAAGITEKSYVETCRAGSTAAAPPAAPSKPAASPAAATAAKPPASTVPATTSGSAPAAKPVPNVPAVPIGANQFSTEALAKSHCSRDIVVWANLNSKIYHFSGNKDFGNTKEGAYMCEKDAVGQGIRAAKNEKRP